jgi:colanic acid biosynthesis glycosyl transferase WcaI
MRFLILTQYYSPEIGAPQTRLAAMARVLRAQGHEVEVVTAVPNYPQGRIFSGYKGRFSVRENYQGVAVHRSWVYASSGGGPKRLLNYLSFAATSVLGLARAEKPDVLFIESPPLFLGVPGLLWARKSGVRTVFNVADLWPDSVVEMGLMRDGVFIQLARQLEKWIYRKADYVAAMTDHIRGELIEKKQVPAEKVVFFPNGVDLAQYTFSEPDRTLKGHLGLADKKIVLYQGTQGYAHGLDEVIRTVAAMKADTDIHFLFLGSGSEHQHLLTAKKQLKLDNATFHDPVPVTELRRFFSICECGLVSLKDNRMFRGARPAKVNPIFGAGKPVAFFGGGEGAEIVRAAEAGIVVRHGDVAGLAEAIRTLARNEDVAAEMGKNGRRYAEEHLSWDLIVRRWLRQIGVADAGNANIPQQPSVLQPSL